MIDDDDMYRNVCRDLHTKVCLSFSYKLKLSLIQRHNLHNLCVYIPLLENRKIIRHIFEEFNAKFQYRTLVQGK